MCKNSLLLQWIISFAAHSLFGVCSSVLYREVHSNHTSWCHPGEDELWFLWRFWVTAEVEVKIWIAKFILPFSHTCLFIDLKCLVARRCPSRHDAMTLSAVPTHMFELLSLTHSAHHVCVLWPFSSLPHASKMYFRLKNSYYIYITKAKIKNVCLKYNYNTM